MGLAEDLKALQELRDKGELSESAYTAARDAAIGKQGQPVTAAKTKPLLSKPPKIFLAGAILIVGPCVFLKIYDKASSSQSPNLFHQPLTITDGMEKIPAVSW